MQLGETPRGILNIYRKQLYTQAWIKTSCKKVIIYSERPESGPA